jgi:DNA-binding MarR family transcriptional regulator
MDRSLPRVAIMTDATCAADAAAFAELFPAVYLRFHRRDAKRDALPAASRAVLQHLSGAGPLTIGEMARHLSRALSVVSEVVDHLERDGLLERMRDQRDRRRALVWLTEAGIAHLDRDRDVLSRELLARAMARMAAADRRALLAGMNALVQADREAAEPVSLPTHQRPKRRKR